MALPLHRKLKSLRISVAQRHSTSMGAAAAACWSMGNLLSKYRMPQGNALFRLYSLSGINRTCPNWGKNLRALCRDLAFGMVFQYGGYKTTSMKKLILTFLGIAVSIA